MTERSEPHQALHLVALPEAALAALVRSELAVAGELLGLGLSDFFITPEARWLWRLRLDQLREHPQDAGWVAFAGVVGPARTVVGRAGFHGAPDDAGMVEVGYSVDPLHRRRGHARAMLRRLLERAAAEPTVRTVRASIRPDNAASLATIAGFGFVQVGQQMDEIDGLELVFERPAGWSGAPLSGLGA